LSPLNNLIKPRRVKNPVYLTFLISVGLHGLLVIPFWQFRTLHLTVPDRPMQLVLEIPLTEQTQSVAPLRRRANRIIPSKTAPVKKPKVKKTVETQPVTPLAELPEQPQEKPAKIPELSSPPLEQVKPVLTQTEVKAVTAAVEPVKALPEPAIVAKAGTRPIENSAPPAAAESVAAPAAERPAVSSAFLQSVYRKIEKCKRYPRLARDRGIEGETLLEFVLAHDGKLVGARVLRSSGFAILDQEALRIVRRAAPFSKLPEGTLVGRVVLKVPISFAIMD
jgi:protein TonB